MTHWQNGFGFHFGPLPDGFYWLRSSEGRYKKIDRHFLAYLRQCAANGIPDDLDTPQYRQLRSLAENGFFTPGPVIEHPSPPDIHPGGIIALFVILFVVNGIMLISLWNAPWPPIPSWENGWITLVFFFLSGLCHEFGHYAAARPYFQPKIRFALLNNFWPALVTLTNEAWTLPRGIRLRINLAGPLVDLILAAAILCGYAVAPQAPSLLLTLALILMVRVVLVMNPLLEGDGYWCLCDSLGISNLRRRGWDDLRTLQPTGYALYSLLSILFSALLLALAGYFVLTLGASPS